MKIKYRNIAISGLPGAGSTTLAKELQKKLRWKYFSGGDFMRAYATKNGLFDGNNKMHHDATIYSADFDRKVDYGMRKNMKEHTRKIYDSWLCGFLAQGVEGTYKILCRCSDDAVRVDRLANRDGLTIQQAKEHIFDRERKNVGKWRKMYKKEWEKWVVEPGFVRSGKKPYYWYPEMYDLVIDTFRASKEEAFEIAWKGISSS